MNSLTEQFCFFKMGKILVACPTSETLSVSCNCDFVSIVNIFGEQIGMESSPAAMNAPLLHSQLSTCSYRPDIITHVICVGV